MNSSDKFSVGRIGSLFRKVSERVRVAGGIVEVISGDSMVLVCGMSRSGTTLLTAVLDSHPNIVCGAELLPARLPSIAETVAKLDATLAATGGDFSMVGRHLRQQDERELGLFLVRCHRAGATHEEVRAALLEVGAMFPGPIESLGQRLRVAQAVMRKRALRTGAAIYGFKYTSAATEVAAAYLPNSVLLGIIRDPFDVVLSHQKRGFDRTTAEICATWNSYARNYRQYAEQHPETCRIVRYEDLVRQPRRTLIKAFEVLKVGLHPAVFEFYRSDSPIHDGFHPNAERLRMNFSTDSIGKGRLQLPAETRHQIETACRGEMQAWGYDNPGYVRRAGLKRTDKLLRIGKAERFARKVIFTRKRKFTSEDYALLLEPYQRDYEIMPIGDYVRETDIGDRKIMMIRHDVDHDLENAMKIAKWEADRGLRTTYCLLHTAWYYGRFEKGRYRHSDFLVEGIERLCELGHEINFHNNLVALALQENVDPISVLESELEFYDRLGVPIRGSSTHGDALCDQLKFRNWEVFRECCDDRFGGPRVIEYKVDGKVRKCRVGERPMSDFGLEYEAYDMAKDVYHTESGGKMRHRENTRGRRPFGRTDPARGSVCGILTHPIWWSF